MGRKPNPVASEFFVRGRKLDDASNRYEQTCKFCSERFPKGRVDTLVTHIVKQCAAVPFQDRQRAALQLGSSSRNSNIPVTLDAHDVNTQFVSVPLQTDPGLSALETLAEVSRHHLDYQSQNNPANPDHLHNVEGEGPPHKKRRVQSKAKAKAFPLPHARDNPFTDATAAAQQYPGMTDAEAQTLAAALYVAEASQQQEVDPTTEFLVQDDIGEPNETRTSFGNFNTSTPSALQLAASAASELMAPQTTAGPEAHLQGANETPFLFTRFRANNALPSAIDPQLHTDTSVDDDVANVIAKAAGLKTIASKTPPPEPYNEQSKQKTRGKFSDTRRKEVQKIRSLGACMRCRMLKKPCSQETPCMQCSKIDSARLWTQPCIRTKLQDEVSLWSCGLFTVRAFQSISKVRSMLYFESTPGRLEVTVLPTALLHLTFAGLRATRMHADAHDPLLLGTEGITTISDVQCIASEVEDVLAKVERYTYRLATDFHIYEPSAFMRVTLEFASMLALNQPAMLILSVSELWLCTSILSGNLPLQLGFNVGQYAQDYPLTLDDAVEGALPSIPITTETNRKTYDIINAQILAATEKRAAVLARVVLNELERRLIQRQQEHRFEILLVSVILLASVERMCAVYRSFSTQAPPTSEMTATAPHQPASEKQQAHLTDPALQDLEDQIRRAAGASSMAAQQDAAAVMPPLDWPLEYPLSYYYQQGDQILEILHMLLRMRDVIPATSVDGDGVVVIASEKEGEQWPQAKAWLETVSLKEWQLREAVEEGKELKFLARLFG